MLAAAAIILIPPRAAVTAIVDVNLVPMDREIVLPHQTVLISAGRVTAVGPSARLRPPAGATTIAGAGRYLMPALIDMHAHVLHEADLAEYLASGVMTVRNMWGTDGVRDLQTRIAAGSLEGPAIISASPGLDGTPHQWPGTVDVPDSASASAAVRDQVAAGWRYIKVYTQLTPPAYHGIMVAAHAAGIPVIGHVPLRISVLDALASGQVSIEHLSGYDRAVSRTSRSGTWGWADADTARFAPLIAATVAARAWNCPTLAIFLKLAEQYNPAERTIIAENRRRAPFVASGQPSPAGVRGTAPHAP